MDILSLLAGAGGALLRLAPEVLKILDAKNERAHAVEIAKINAEVSRDSDARALAKAQEDNASAEEQLRLQGQIEGIKGQAAPSGVQWIDGLSASVRPVAFYTGWLMVLGEALRIIPTIHPETRMLISGMVGFYFMHRTMRQK